MSFLERILKISSKASKELDQHINYTSEKESLNKTTKTTINSTSVNEDTKKYLIDRLAKIDETKFDIDDIDPLFEDAARLTVQSQMASTSLLQKRMKINKI